MTLSLPVAMPVGLDQHEGRAVQDFGGPVAEGHADLAVPFAEAGVELIVGTP